MSYDLKSISLPRLEGRMLALAARAFDVPVLRQLLLQQVLRDAGMTQARSVTVQEPPMLIPERPAPRHVRAPIASDFLTSIPHTTVATLPRPRARDYAIAYRSGTASPDNVADAVLQAIAEADRGDRPLRAFISVLADDVREQARASAERFRSGKPLSILDGVPVAIKDEIDQVPHATTLGTRVRSTPVRVDSATVEKLRALGALLIGKTNMHEVGLNPTGVNTHYGQVRNPYNADHDPGGSSSGSAAAVAAGLCPIAMGADGGGSIRIPAALCGVVGLKATFGRLSQRGVPSICYSVGHAGILGAGVEDVALAYAALAGADPTAVETIVQPRASLERYAATTVQGLRIGVYTPWFEHADREIVDACSAALERLVARGAVLVEIELPLLDAMRIAHGITILGEMAGSMREFFPDWGVLSPIARVSLALTKALRADDYVWAQRFRTRAMRAHAHAFASCDIIATPATAITAPPIPRSGAPWLDLGVVTELMRYIVAGNFLGYPALSVPVGYSRAGLPIGMQLMAPHWEEDILLGIAQEVEREAPLLNPLLLLSPLS